MKQDFSGTFLHYMMKSSKKCYFETVFVEGYLFSPVGATEIYLSFSFETSLEFLSSLELKCHCFIFTYMHSQS